MTRRTRWRTRSIVLYAVTVAFSVPNVSLLVVGQPGPTFVDQDITTDTTWVAESGPYVVVGNVTVAEGAKLTVMPETVVKFAAKASLQIKGSLLADGSGILFTSNRPSPKEGDWQGLFFSGGTSSLLLLQSVRLQYAETAVRIEATSLGRYTLSNCVVEFFASAGVHISQGLNAGSVVEECRFSNGKGFGIRIADVEAPGPTYNSGQILDVTVRENVIQGTGTGIYVDTEPHHVLHSTIRGLKIEGNQIGGAGTGIHLRATKFASNSPGKSELIQVTVANNTIRDSLYRGIALGSGRDGSSATEIRLEGNRIWNGNQIGVELSGYEPLQVSIDNNSIALNAGEGLKAEGPKVSVVAANNDIRGNGFGARLVDKAAVDARNNFWGDPSGPYHESINPTGTGDKVSGDGTDLKFIPWLQAERFQPPSLQSTSTPPATSVTHWNQTTAYSTPARGSSSVSPALFLLVVCGTLATVAAYRRLG